MHSETERDEQALRALFPLELFRARPDLTKSGSGSRDSFRNHFRRLRT